MTLRHYDDIGLLRPAEAKADGQRVQQEWAGFAPRLVELNAAMAAYAQVSL